MKINKKEGLLLLSKLKLPTVELINYEGLTLNDERIKLGLSVDYHQRKIVVLA